MQPLWTSPINLEKLNASNKNTIHESLGIVFTAFGDDFLEATMPVDSRTHQPFGRLHGGASVVLAESLGSVASLHIIGVLNAQDRSCVGIEINASHLRGIQSGSVTGRATPLRIGQSLHVWEIHIWNTADLEKKPICISRLTVMVVGKDPK